jgi:hypothetical protein
MLGNNMRSRLINVERWEVEMSLPNFQNKTDTPIRDWVDKIDIDSQAKDFKIKQREISVARLICKRDNRKVQHGIGYGLQNLAENN